jgi:hypothetical protein
MANLTRGSTAGGMAPAIAKAPYTITRVVDTSTTNLAAGVHQIINVPANFQVLHASVQVTTAETVGTTGTVALGDTGSAARYVAAATVAATGYMTQTGAKGVPNVAATTIDITVAVATLSTAKLLVTAVLVDLSRG